MIATFAFAGDVITHSSSSFFFFHIIVIIIRIGTVIWTETFWMAHHTTHINVCECVAGLAAVTNIPLIAEACPRATIAVSVPIARAVIVAIGCSEVVVDVIAVVFVIEWADHIRTIE